MKRTDGQNDAWISTETEENGVTVIVRLRGGIPVADTVTHPHQINIIWDYDGMSDGMPEPQALLVIERFSAALLRLDEELSDAFLVVSTLGDDRAQWIWYTADVEAYMARFSTALREFESFPFDMETMEDPEWEAYAELRGAVKS